LDASKNFHTFAPDAKNTRASTQKSVFQMADEPAMPKRTDYSGQHISSSRQRLSNPKLTLDEK